MSLTVSPPAKTAITSRSAGASQGDTATRSAATKPSAHRDRAIDLVRFGCLFVVVILHSMMSGAQLGADGVVDPIVALSTTDGFAIASWGFQVMPLFFIIGGFAGLSAWRRSQSKGLTWMDYLRSRVRRLAAPVTILIGVAGLGLTAASALGMPSELVAEASLRIGQPLWFLAVYIGLTSLVPLAARFHDKAPRLTIVALIVAVVLVDQLARATGITGLGYLNFLFVWPLIQQAGFFYVDMVRRPVRRGPTVALMIAALVSLGVMVAAGAYSPSMLANLNPPTGALVLLGLAQMCALRLGHSWLSSVVSGARAKLWDRIIDWGNEFGMHVYLWHMIVIITIIAGLGALAGSEITQGFGADMSGILLPAIESPWWWASRPLWLVAVVVLSAGLAIVMSKVDIPRNAVLSDTGQILAEVCDRRMSELGWRGLPRLSEVQRGGLSVGLAIVGIAVALLVGVASLGWTLVSLAALVAAMILAAGLGQGAALRVNRQF